MPTQGRAPDPDLIAEAYDRYYHQDQSFRDIGKAMGFSHVTAANYVRMGEYAQQSTGSLNAAIAKQGLTLLLRQLTSHTAGLLGLDDDELSDAEKIERIEKVGPELRWQIQELAKITGAYAPVKAEIASNASQNSKINDALDQRRTAREKQERQAIEDGRRNRNG